MAERTTSRDWFEPVGGLLPVQRVTGTPPGGTALDGAAGPLVLGPRDLAGHDLDGVLADALTARPNEVVLDLTGPCAGDVPRHRVRRALRALAGWPHPPVLVAVDAPHGPVPRPSAAPDPGLRVDVVAGTALATAVVTARRWVEADTLVMTPPLVSRALALGHVVGFLERTGTVGRVEDAVESTDVLLRWAAAGGADRVEVRVAVDDAHLGIALAWRPAAGADGVRSSFAVPLLGSIAGHAAHVVGDLRLGWVSLRRASAGAPALLDVG